MTVGLHLRGNHRECRLLVMWMPYVGSGDAAARGLLGKLLLAGAAPYFKMLERWLCEGVLDDPFSEFMVEENTVIFIPVHHCSMMGIILIWQSLRSSLACITTSFCGSVSVSLAWVGALQEQTYTGTICSWSFRSTESG